MREASLRVIQDYIDLTGDGIPEHYHIDGATSGVMHVESWSPGADEAPGLLETVTNGIGGNVHFHWARSSDTTVARSNSGPDGYAPGWPDWITPAMPFPTWVVKKVDVDDGRDDKADGTVHTTTTSYFYEDPVFAPDVPTIGGDDGHTVLAAPGRRFRRLPSNGIATGAIRTGSWSTRRSRNFTGRDTRSRP